MSTGLTNQGKAYQKRHANMVVREQVESNEHATRLDEALPQNPIDLLYSSESDDDGVVTIRLSDCSSKAQCICFLVQDVPAIGIVDTAADIAIMEANCFRK